MSNSTGKWDTRTTSPAFFPESKPIQLEFKVTDLSLSLQSMLRQIIDGGGYISEDDIQVLVQELPAIPVVIKWGAAPRSVLPVKEALVAITACETAQTDYVREVFFSAGYCDALGKALTAR